MSIFGKIAEGAKNFAVNNYYAVKMSPTANSIVDTVKNVPQAVKDNIQFEMLQHGVEYETSDKIIESTKHVVKAAGDIAKGDIIGATTKIAVSVAKDKFDDK